MEKEKSAYLLKEGGIPWTRAVVSQGEVNGYGSPWLTDFYNRFRSHIKIKEENQWQNALKL